MKVYEKAGSYNYSNGHVPELRIGGAWLARHGFNVGDHIELAVKEEHITIRRIAVEAREPKRKR